MSGIFYSIDDYFNIAIFHSFAKIVDIWKYLSRQTLISKTQSLSIVLVSIKRKNIKNNEKTLTILVK